MKSDKSIAQVIFSVKMMVKCAVAFVVVAVILAAVGCGFENWRGKRDWERCKADLEAKGEHLTMDYFIPPPVPDEKNFALTPLLKPLLDYTNAKDEYGGYVLRDSDPPIRKISTKVPEKFEDYPQSKLKTWQTGDARPLDAWQAYYRKSLLDMKLSKSPAEDIIAATGRFDAMFAELRDGMQSHPLCRYPLHYELGMGLALPHLSVLQEIAKVLSLRASAELQMNNPEAAFADLQLGYRLIDSFRDEPTVVDGLVRIAALNVLLQAVWEGIASHRWNEEQLVELERELQGWDYLSNFNRCMRMERGCVNWVCEKARGEPGWLADMLRLTANGDNDIYPPRYMRPFNKAAIYRNQILINTLIEEKFLNFMDEKAKKVDLALLNGTQKTIDSMRVTPYTFLAKIMLPVFGSVGMKYAQMQTYVNEGAIACEIERYRLKHGALPATLAELQMADLPHDVMTGEPLHYRVDGGDNYVLYSVGWNGADDGGTLKKNEYGTPEYKQGDWVWSLKPL